MSSRSRQQLESWLKTIDVSGKVLDIGGSQNPIKGRTKSWNVDDYKILDLLSPHECKQEPDIIVDLNEDFALSKEMEKIENWIDVMFCIEISEYLYIPSKTLLNLSIFLKYGGVLYISFHWLYGLHNPKGEDCLRYTRYGIEKLLKETGFEILEMTPRTISEEGKKHLINFYKTEGMRLDYNDPETYVEGYLVKARKK